MLTKKSVKMTEWHSYPSVTFQYPLSHILVNCMSELPHFSWLNDIVSSCSCLCCKNLKKRLLAESQSTIKNVWLYEQWESEALAAKIPPLARNKFDMVKVYESWVFCHVENVELVPFKLFGYSWKSNELYQQFMHKCNII